MRTRNLDEAIDAVSKVYCPHTVEVMGPAGEIDAFLEVSHPTSQPLVRLSYSAPVKIDAKNFSRLFLMMGCESGAAAATQERQTAEWGPGQTMPFSAGFQTQLWFDRAFVQRSVRLDIGKLETQCARWLGHPLDQPLRFALRPFSNELERLWRRTLTYLWSSEDGVLPLTGAAKNAFDEYLLTLLLHHHPHNYSEAMAEKDTAPVPGMVRRAERYMSDNAAAPMAQHHTQSSSAAGPPATRPRRAAAVRLRRQRHVDRDAARLRASRPLQCPVPSGVWRTAERDPAPRPRDIGLVEPDDAMIAA
jgi:hypothetical protein